MKKLMFLTMMFGLMMVFNGSVSAQEQNCGNPADGEVIVFEHTSNHSGGGKCVKLKVGEYKDAAAIGLVDNSMSSIKVGKGVYAVACDGPNLTGACEVFDGHDDDLRNNPTIKNDRVSSIKVVQSKNSQVCSPRSNEKIPIKWTNKTNRTLRINWINFDCKEENNPREIKPGEVYDGGSFVGHVFRVTDFNTKENLGLIYVTSSNATQDLK